jgi:hypothetical protein
MKRALRRLLSQKSLICSWWTLTCRYLYQPLKI